MARSASAGSAAIVRSFAVLGIRVSLSRVSLAGQLDLQFGAVEHRAIVVAGGPFQKRLHIAFDAAFKHGAAIRDYFDGLVEIEFIG